MNTTRHNQMDEALLAFTTESRDLLDSMEGALLRIEQQPSDPEAINAVFRAAHTIKGSAGIFGLDHIVAFTHVAENVLDRVRHGDIVFDPALANLMFAVGDHIRALVSLVGQGRQPDADGLARGIDLVMRLEAVGDAGASPFAAHAASPAMPSKAPVSAVDVPAEPSPAAAGHGIWHITIRFGQETIRDGFDPLSFLRYLGTFGEITRIITLVEQVPPLSELEPDSCHLGFELSFCTQASLSDIEGAFDFVREDSDLTIVPPADHDARPAEETTGAPSNAAAVATPRPTASQAPCPEPAATASARKPQDASAPESRQVKVDTAKLDRLIDLVGELIIAGAGAHLTARRHRIKELTQATSTVTRLMEEVRDSALKLRMVQIAGTFNRFQRVVRDVSQELGKDIALKVSGADTELDKTMVDKLADPLTHLVRNAMDHGIESAERRAQAGKPAQGTVSLHARHDAGQVVIEVSDDGGGLSRERILRKAMERGLIAPDAVLGDPEVFALVFEAGFSTAEQVSKLSGRGVGMDVVKRCIQAMRGTIELRSQEGRGTTVCIRLPLTLAIIDGFLLGVGKAAYVVPLGAVVECIEMSRQRTTSRDWLDLRGEVLPLVRLRDLYSIEGDAGRRQNIVVVQGAGQRIGLVVDQLMGELQTVIKPLGQVFQQVRGIGGFTILGNGAVALLLDVPNLVAQVTMDSEAGFQESRAVARRPAPRALA